MPGKFVLRVLKSLHAKLSALAKQEGVSINTLVLYFKQYHAFLVIVKVVVFSDGILIK